MVSKTLYAMPAAHFQSDLLRINTNPLRVSAISKVNPQETRHFPAARQRSPLVSLREHMRQRDLSPPCYCRYTNKARDFLVYISERGIELAAVHPDHVESYLHARRQQYRRRHGVTCKRR